MNPTKSSLMTLAAALALVLTPTLAFAHHPVPVTSGRSHTTTFHDHTPTAHDHTPTAHR
jgi:hypothetical protein